jgi:Tfp pilus assembly protein PilO
MTGGPDRKVVFALLGIAALCLIGLGVSLYRAKGTELAKLARELKAKETQLTEVRLNLTKQPELEAKYSRLQARLSVLEPGLPNSAYMPTFLRQIERLATETNNRIVMIRPKAKPATGRSAAVTMNNETGEVVKEEPKAAGSTGKAGKESDKTKLPYDYSSIELKIEGTYTTILSFLKELQQFPKMIAVNDISFSPKQSGSLMQSPELVATMDLTAVVTKVTPKGGKDGTS